MKSSVVVKPHNEHLPSAGPKGLATLMPLAYQGQDMSLLAQELIDMASLDDSNASFDLSILLQLIGDKDTGLKFQKQALDATREYRISPGCKRSKVKLLALVTKGDLMTNTPLEFIAEGAGFELTLLFVDTNTPLPKAVPEHDVAIVALSELDRNRPCLALLEAWLLSWPRPVLNMPSNVRALSRDVICKRLQNYNCINMPNTIRTSADFLRSMAFSSANAFEPIESEVQLPMIIRPIDSHAGQGLARIEHQDDLKNYLSTQPASEFFVSNYINYTSQDGFFRKYRVVFIDGRPRLVHMAVSTHWMIHYLNAGMSESASKRLDESSAMGNFDNTFARKHKHAFSQLCDTVGLDYFGIDCAETKDGKLLIFEVGASLNVHSMDNEKIFPYKKNHINKIYTDFLDMLKDKASSDINGLIH